MSVDPFWKIQNMYPEFHRVEKKVADYILSHQSDIAHQTAAEIAANSGVAAGSVVRFSKVIGYSGFSEMRLAFAKYQPVPGDKTIYATIGKDDPLPVLTEKVFQQSIDTLQSTLSMLSDASMERAVDILASAKRIVFFGIGSSSPLAQDSAYRFSRAGFPAEAIADPHIARITASMLSSDSAVVGISHTGRSAETVSAMTLAKKSGAKTISVTSFLKSPLTALCDVNLVIASSETAVLNEAISSRIAQIVVLDSLYVGLAMRKPEETAEKILNMNRILEEMRI
ncbi:MAG: MurR/RpiR family transcriptional regulator [Lachnospiraceae bacterium]|nr:MurR/RpiR family transcriptional regulator [Lachnospiraceae bacterium]